MELAKARVSSRACKRAFDHGKVTLLGGFSAIPPSGRPGWIIRVISRNDTRWNVAVVTDDIRHDFVVQYCDAVPWAAWCGNTHLFSPLHQGDIPGIASWNRSRTEEQTDGK